MNISTLLLPIIRILHRYHLTIFIVIAFGGLALVMLSINQTIDSSTAVTQGSTTTSSDIPTLDKATMKKIDALQPSGLPSVPLNLTGRSNPFSE